MPTVKKEAEDFERTNRMETENAMTYSEQTNRMETENDMTKQV